MPIEPEHEHDEFLDSDEVSREYWGDEAAGCIFIAKDTGRILLAHRSNQTEYEPETWGTWGGKVDGNETPKDALVREIEEEAGFNGNYTIHPLYVYRDGNFAYHNYLIVVPFEFTPQLNWENDNSAWVEYGNWPTPLHFGMVELLKHSGAKIQRILELIKKKKDKLMTENQETPIQVGPQGMTDISTRGYKWQTPYGYLAFGYDESSKVFHLLMIQTKKEYQSKGYSKELLRKFFEFMKKHNGKLNPGPYTMSGMAWTKHILERFAKEFGVPIINVRHPQDDV